MAIHLNMNLRVQLSSGSGTKKRKFLLDLKVIYLRTMFHSFTQLYFYFRKYAYRIRRPKKSQFILVEVIPVILEIAGTLSLRAFEQLPSNECDYDGKYF